MTGARVAVGSYGWERIAVDGQPHDHAFRRPGGEVRTAVVTVDGEDAHVLAGLQDLVVLKSTGSEFWGYPKDRYTTLPETRDRILATAVTARWRYTSTDVDFSGVYDRVRTTLLETFASLHSLALQQTLYRMGRGGARAARAGRRGALSPCRTSTTSCRTSRRSASTTTSPARASSTTPTTARTAHRGDGAARRRASGGGRVVGYAGLLLRSMA